MEGWKKYEGKKVFLKLRSNREYTGVVTSVDESSAPLVFINLKDKFNQDVTIAHSEIIFIEEERQ